MLDGGTAVKTAQSSYRASEDTQDWTEVSAIAHIVKDKALNFLVGEVLKREPRADPLLVRLMIVQRLVSSDYDDPHSDSDRPAP